MDLEQCEECASHQGTYVPEESMVLCKNCAAAILFQVSAMCTVCAADFSPTDYKANICTNCK